MYVGFIEVIPFSSLSSESIEMKDKGLRHRELNISCVELLSKNVAYI